MVAAPSYPSLDSLPPTLRTLASRGQPRRYRKGTLLIQEGEFGDTPFIVLTGRVKAFSSVSRGHEIIDGVYGPGEYLGELSLDGGPRSASVITLEATACIVIMRSALQEHIAANPEFAFELLARVIRRARLATRSARSMALLDVYGRVVECLNELAVEQPDGSRQIAQRLTHRDIADRVGCSREVARLGKLRRRVSQEGSLLASQSSRNSSDERAIDTCARTLWTRTAQASGHPLLRPLRFDATRGNDRGRTLRRSSRWPAANIYENVVPRHGGTIVRIQGDGTLAIFGYPEAGEDDGRRAAQAALELHAHVRNLQCEPPLPRPWLLALHTGMHAGLVLFDDGDLLRGRFDLLGNAPNIAARLSEMAEHDQIRVSAPTLGTELHFFETAAPRRVILRGASEPLTVHRILLPARPCRRASRPARSAAFCRLSAAVTSCSFSRSGCSGP